MQAFKPKAYDRIIAKLMYHSKDAIWIASATKYNDGQIQELKRLHDLGTRLNSFLKHGRQQFGRIVSSSAAIP